MMIHVCLVIDDDALAEQLTFKGSAIARHLSLFATIAADKGIIGIEDYFSRSPDRVREILKHELGLTEEEVFELPEERWFSAEEGLQLLDTYRRLIEENRDWIGQEVVEEILVDFGELEDDFFLLHKHGKHWHFSFSKITSQNAPDT